MHRALPSLSPANEGRSDLGLIEVAVTLNEVQSACGFVTEITPTDLRIEINAPMPLGDPARFQLTSVFYDFETTVDGVVHWQVRRNDRYIAGVFLSERLQNEIVQKCWTDARRESRYNGCCHVELLVDGVCQRALLVNYSRSGLSIQTRQPIALNQVVTVRTRQYSVRCIVRWNTEDSDCGHLTGCELLSGDGEDIARMISGCQVKE